MRSCALPTDKRATRDEAYAFVAGTAFVAFLAYLIFTTVTVVVFTTTSPTAEIVVLSRALARSPALQGCFITYAAIDFFVRVAWYVWYSHFDVSVYPWIKYLRASMFLLNPIFQICVGAITMDANGNAHSAMAIVVTVTFLVYIIASIVAHGMAIRKLKSKKRVRVIAVSLAVEVLATVLTIVGVSCFLANSCTGSSAVTSAWYEYVMYMFVAMMGTVRAVDVALTERSSATHYEPLQGNDNEPSDASLATFGLGGGLSISTRQTMFSGT